MIIAYNTDTLTLNINEHLFTDFKAGDTIIFERLGDHTTRENFANGGVSIGSVTDSEAGTLTINLQGKGKDDIYLSNLANSKTPIVLSGYLKQPYTADGEDRVETILLDGGSIKTLPNITMNNKDSGDYNTVPYVLEFRTAKRTL